MHCCRRIGKALVTLVAGALLQFAAIATASTDYAVNIDRNFFVRAIDWTVTGAGASVLVLTYPALNQPHIREGCTVNFYVLEVTPSLETTELRRVAENYCGHRLDESGRLLDTGDVVLLIDDRVETWRPGVGQVAGWPLSDVQQLQRRHPSLTRNVRHIDVHGNGFVALSSGFPRARGDVETPSAVIAGLSLDGTLRWEHVFAEPGVQLSTREIWATADGGALLHVSASPMRGPGYPDGVAPADMADREDRLYRFSAAGEFSEPAVIASLKRPDEPAALPDMNEDPEGYRKALNRTIDSLSHDSETVGRVFAHSRPDGNIDLLLGGDSKEVRIIRVDVRGKIILDENLAEAMNMEDRPRWQYGYVTGDAVTVFGALGLKETRLPQGYASRFDLESQRVTTRLAPLEGPGLEAAINVRDSEQRLLEHNPSQQPQLLAMLAGKPLMVSTMIRSRKQGLQLAEVDDSLQSYPVQQAESEKPQRPPQPTTLPALPPMVSPGECDCSCEALTAMRESAEALQSEAKATGRPPPVNEFMRVSQCMMRCQAQVAACMRAQ